MRRFICLPRPTRSVYVWGMFGYIGEGELAFAGIEVAARVQLRVERSEGGPWTGLSS